MITNRRFGTIPNSQYSLDYPSPPRRPVSYPVSQSAPLACPTCGAEYKIVRVEAKTVVLEGRLTCPKCGGPRHAREGHHTLKYFLVGGSRKNLRPRTRS
jgi:predicted RNA-binding Zn-ribbon protein involved in translation (DUF1610 family)